MLKPQSPQQFYHHMKELNTPYTCPKCNQPGKTQEERLFVEDIGACYVCDKLSLES
jgi:hypothetical protein